MKIKDKNIAINNSKIVDEFGISLFKVFLILGI
jgi:hypothetical protein